ncbi:hypothetical protein [Microbacterium sp. VKM Ac-2923]|uniref:hypothetical protein n=1 Tax=Microbacterium sp. VKM Ac-2923 TaxID=2929476 RepID=UPI001FB3DB78|nr:hypothetical protein [Microbacterium sp. VKM Ac-2923]MCJ1709280.1 hypothetical protein [Microbacterium sp. VKM Ac-2923]
MTNPTPIKSRLQIAQERAARDDLPSTASENLDDYETVATRVSRFWRSHSKGRILTEIHETTHRISREGGSGYRWVVKASVWKDKTDDDVLDGRMPDATGFATETDGSGDSITAASALETAETSAVGRALANLGKNGKSPRPTREGVERTRAKVAATAA